ncbi:hydroxymethylbilane synthase [Capnocytophaga sp. oral taxon 412 str. F0487]|uniref:hydroxymethylbilane synthase n=1 Tax=Capnocytophaga sp. oral taxon 412 TaxID=712218 RepID=UPI0002696C14|nr:hydroxymethylbilane synthase [Capnocytophaga sp. oral taxon 412]EIW93736.1 hydroxymethylbilane synthase [Capnocytophaga sp. oral taxon 412 str. F0487]
MNIIRIGTRDSELALWQAKTVQNQLKPLGYPTEIVSTKSHGDIELSKPLYEMGVTGIFTKALDIALLNSEIDIAVHSMKDVPTALAEGIVVGAVLKRGNPHDVLVYKGDLSFLEAEIATIATSSLRRKAQWLHRYPHHNIESLRGNVNTRLQKLTDNPWNGAIFAAAGLERINKLPEKHLVLDWMLPAPAQGAIVVVVREDNVALQKKLLPLHDDYTYIATQLERDFLRALEGGCTAPIGAFAEFKDEKLYFKGGLWSEDGKESSVIDEVLTQIDEYTGEKLATMVRS